MPRAKPKWGYCAGIISQDIDYIPEPAEIDALIHDLSKIVCIDLKQINNEKIKHPDNETISFHKFLLNLVQAYRERVLEDRYSPTKASMLETINHLDRIAQEMEKRFEPLSIDGGLDYDTLILLDEYFPEDHKGFAQFHEDGIMIQKAIKKARKELNQTDERVGRKSDLEHKVWLANNIVLTFENLLNLSTTKTRGNKLDKTISCTLKACGFEQGEFSVSGYIPEQNFKVMKTAIDQFRANPKALDPWATRKIKHYKLSELPPPKYSAGGNKSK